MRTPLGAAIFGAQGGEIGMYRYTSTAERAPGPLPQRQIGGAHRFEQRQELLGIGVGRPGGATAPAATAGDPPGPARASGTPGSTSPRRTRRTPGEGTRRTVDRDPRTG